jgi:hypothetical protein
MLKWRRTTTGTVHFLVDAVNDRHQAEFAAENEELRNLSPSITCGEINDMINKLHGAGRLALECAIRMWKFNADFTGFTEFPDIASGHHQCIGSVVPRGAAFKDTLRSAKRGRGSALPQPLASFPISIVASRVDIVCSKRGAAVECVAADLAPCELEPPSKKLKAAANADDDECYIVDTLTGGRCVGTPWKPVMTAPAPAPAPARHADDPSVASSGSSEEDEKLPKEKKEDMAPAERRRRNLDSNAD